MIPVPSHGVLGAALALALHTFPVFMRYAAGGSDVTDRELFGCSHGRQVSKADRVAYVCVGFSLSGVDRPSPACPIGISQWCHVALLSVERAVCPFPPLLSRSGELSHPLRAGARAQRQSPWRTKPAQEWGSR